MKNIDNNIYMSNVNSIICPKGTTEWAMIIFFIYIAYISFQMTKKLQ
jgi:hypothetical protein